MISAGELAIGSRLPTVRELSKELGVSPTTVSEAGNRWPPSAPSTLAAARARSSASPPGPATPRRYRRVTEGPGHFELDLSSGTPDPALLPDLRPVIAHVSRQSLTSSYLDHRCCPSWPTRVRADWPFPPEELTVVDGAMDALDRVASVIVRLGDRVVVENPTFPPLLDLLELLGAEVIGVDMDDEGMLPDGLADALAAGATAVFLQPRAHNPTGITLTAARGQQLAAALADSDAIVVEDDHSGDIASGALVSLGEWLPQRTVHIRSYSKSHGPDLRLAAVGGAGDVVSAVANRRLLGPGWSSRILQAVLLEMLDHQPTIDAVDAARAEYAARAAGGHRCARRAGVGFTGTDGINLWMQVADERSALLTLAAQGIGAAPGEPFMVRDDAPSLRVTVGLIDDSIADVRRPPRRSRRQPTQQEAASASHPLRNLTSRRSSAVYRTHRRLTTSHCNSAFICGTTALTAELRRARSVDGGVEQFVGERALGRQRRLVDRDDAVGRCHVREQGQRHDVGLGEPRHAHVADPFDERERSRRRAGSGRRPTTAHTGPRCSRRPRPRHGCRERPAARVADAASASMSTTSAASTAAATPPGSITSASTSARSRRRTNDAP